MSGVSSSQPATLRIGLLIIISLLSQNDLVSSAPTLMSTICIATAGNYTSRGAFQKNLGEALTSLTTSAVSANATFSNTTVGIGRDEVFALYYCTGGGTAEECSSCIQAATVEVGEKCPSSKAAITWYLECTLRYANRMIAGVEEEKPWAWLTSNKTVADYNNLGKVLINMTGDLTQAVELNSTSGGNPPGFAVKEVAISSTETLTGAMQCAPGVTGTSCVQCLIKATSNLGQCCSLFSYINFIFLPSCRILYFVTTSNLTSSTTPPPISYSPESSPPDSSPMVIPLVSPPPPESSNPPSTNGSLGSDGKKLICRSNGIAVIALTVLLVVYLARG